jgi:hypothetical protein
LVENAEKLAQAFGFRSASLASGDVPFERMIQARRE